MHVLRQPGNGNIKNLEDSMTSLSLILGGSHIFIALVTTLLSIPLVRGEMPMNSYYGVRFKKSYESNENWYKINKYGGKQLLMWSMVLAFLGIVTIFLPVDQNNFFPGLLAPLIILVPAVTSYMYAQKL
jgi:hypothetical protein